MVLTQRNVLLVLLLSLGFEKRDECRHSPFVCVSPFEGFIQREARRKLHTSLTVEFGVGRRKLMSVP